MKIGLIGKGYWGNIIYNNLIVLGYQNILTYDVSINNGVTINDMLQCDYIFICTPLETHFELCKFFLKNDKNVFCEKPLTSNLEQCNELYSLAKNKNLFVDWIFTYNESVNFIKKLVSEKRYGELKSISMNRLNYGPIRTDTDARYDLASHDLSILYYILNTFPDKLFWLNYKRNQNSVQNDSVIGLFKIKDIFAQINCSWSYRMKDRTCIFEFENGFVEWNDSNKILKLNNNENIFDEESTPLKNSIKDFLSKKFDFDYQKNLTVNIIKMLLYENTF